MYFHTYQCKIGFSCSDILQKNWFGGNKPLGECSCQVGFEWDDDKLECELNEEFAEAFAWFGMSKIGFIILMIVITCCCFGICGFAAYKILR